MRKQQEKTDRLSLIILAAFLVLSTSHFMCRFDAIVFFFRQKTAYEITR